MQVRATAFAGHGGTQEQDGGREGQCCGSEDGRGGMEPPSRAAEDWTCWRGLEACCSPLSCVVGSLASDHSVALWQGHGLHLPEAGCWQQ